MALPQLERKTMNNNCPLGKEVDARGIVLAGDEKIYCTGKCDYRDEKNLCEYSDVKTEDL